MRHDAGPGHRQRISSETASGTSQQAELRLIFASDPMAVRQALESILSGLDPLSLSKEECETAELVLAEVMNNIVKHAYADTREGVIELRLSHDKHGLTCVLFDDGLPMPDGNPPLGKNHNLSCATKDLPEGGFGWFLIRELSQDLGYSRENKKNRLSFRLPIGVQLRSS